MPKDTELALSQPSLISLIVVVDGATVEAGGFNFTASAEAKNAENVLVLHDPAVAQQGVPQLFSISHSIRFKPC